MKQVKTMERFANSVVVFANRFIKTKRWSFIKVESCGGERRR